MAIEDILRALEDQAQADIDAVLDEAKEHAKLILSEAEVDAENLRDGHVRQLERSATNEAAKLVNAARLDAKMAVSSSRGEGLDAVFVQAADELAKIRSAGGYDKIFAKLAAEALEGLQGPVVVHVDPADASLASSIAAPTGVEITVETDLKTSGGLMIEADGARIVRRNTLEDRLDRVRQFVQADAAKVLFA